MGNLSIKIKNLYWLKINVLKINKACNKCNQLVY